MHKAIKYFDEALALAEQELQALSDDDSERAVALKEKRSELIAQAWAARQDCDNKEYASRIIQMQKIQSMLTEKATQVRQHVREEIVRSRKESRRLEGYHKALTYQSFEKGPAVMPAQNVRYLMNV